MKTRILVVDDERSMREMLSILLEREGYEAVEAKNGLEALQLFETSLFDLVICDIQMPDLNGIDLLARLKKLAPEIPVLMITAFATAEQAVDAIKLGAFHYFTKPFNNDEIRALVRNALEKRDLKRENIQLKQDVQGKEGFCGITGKSPRMRELFVMIQKVAESLSSVLIMGESGTGKELAARAIHNSSPPPRQALRGGQLRGHTRDTHRKRAVWAQEGGLYRRGCRPSRAVRTGRRGYPLSGRDRRAAAALADQALARASGT